METTNPDSQNSPCDLRESRPASAEDSADVQRYRDDLKGYLVSQLGSDYGELKLDTPLIEYGILDSILIQGLLAFVEDRYQILLPPEDVRPERFGTLRGMAQVVQYRVDNDHGRAGTDAFEAINILMESYGLERRWVETGFGKQHVLATHGTGPRLVLLPGLGSPASSWGLLLRSLQRRREAIAIDLGGFGVSKFSTRDDRSLGFEAHVENTLELIEATGTGPYVLVGNSAGAMIAAEIAKSQPKECVGLVSISFGRVRNGIEWRDDLAALSADADQFWNRAFFDPPPLSRGLRARFQETLSSPTYRNFLGDSAVEKLDELFSGVEVPALFIAGQDDRIVPPSIVRAGSDQASNATYAELVRCGHYAQSERSEELLVYLEHFLGTLPSNPPRSVAS